MLEWWENMTKSQGMGKVGMGEFFPSEKRFFCMLWGCSEL